MPIIETLTLTKEELQKTIDFMRVERYVNRYLSVRPYCWGTVIDCACGSGYGSYILQKNPDVERVLGIDKSESAVVHAKSNFLTNKTDFIQIELGVDSLDRIVQNFNILVSLATIEYLKNPLMLPQLASNCKVLEVIISCPHHKASHINPYRYHDFTVGDIEKMFAPHYVIDWVLKLEENDIVFLHRSGRGTVYNPRWHRA